MRQLNASEQRTIRYAAIALGAYLVLFGGFKLWSFWWRQRGDYLKLAAEARQLRAESKTYPEKVAAVKTMMENFHLDPAKLVKNSVMAETSAALQRAANGGGVKPGVIRESPGRAANKELGTIQFEGTGSVASIMSFLQQAPLQGWPVVVDSVQITADAMRPGQVKLALTIIVLDYEQWKKEPTHA